MSDQLIIPYSECFELAQLKNKKQKEGYNNFSNFEKNKYQKLIEKEKHAKEIGRAWVEESTGVTVYTRPTLMDIIKDIFGIKPSKKDSVRWR